MMYPCSHVWIDPKAPPIQRTPVSSVIGTKPHEMHAGVSYVCRNCGATLTPNGPVIVRPTRQEGSND